MWLLILSLTYCLFRCSTRFCSGSPLVWKGKILPFKVPPDQGEVFVDQNAARYPSSPLEPLFRSVEIVAPEFDFAQGIDFVADRNSLRKLHSWVVGGKKQDFRIDLDVAGEKTVLLTRWEAVRKETITEFRGFAQEFEKVRCPDLLPPISNHPE